MALNFPNPVRRFDSARLCVSFWGSDASMEVAFQIDLDALRKLGPGDSETQVLAVFDEHRDTIQKAASTVYAKRRGGYHRLTASDF